METEFSIQQVAEKTGLSIDTLRYYERIGLLEPVSRAPSGHRRYGQRDIDWIGLIINLRETGMPLAQIHHFARLRRQGEATATERLRMLEQHQQALRQQMQRLEQHMTALQHKIAHKKAFLAQRNAPTDMASEQHEEEITPLPEDNKEPNSEKKKRETFMPQTTETHSITTGYVDITVNEEPGPSTMGAYMARPQGQGNYPGVIIGFELFGVTGYIRTIANRIAQLGYVALAPDFYHRSLPGIELEATDEGRARGFELLHQLTRQQAINDVYAAMTHLRNEGKSSKIGMLGLSVGGHIAYLAATQFDLKATVAFYPGWLTTQDIPLSRPVPTLSLTPGIAKHDGYLLLLVGEQDSLLPAEQREAIARELQAANIRHELVIYPDTPHRFFYEEGENYRQVAADDAWHPLREQLATELA